MEANQDEPKPENAAIQQQPATVPVALDDESAARPIFSSDVVTSSTPGHSIDVNVDITGAEKLFLVVTDGRNGFACDWADWAEPRLVSADGETKLTELEWTAASTGWGQVRANANCEGRPMQINGERIEYGIGTHANSIIEFDLPEGHDFTSFKARAGLDNGGTGQGNGTSVQFHVFTERPSRRLARSRHQRRESGTRQPSRG